MIPPLLHAARHRIQPAIARWHQLAVKISPWGADAVAALRASCFQRLSETRRSVVGRPTLITELVPGPPSRENQHACRHTSCTNSPLTWCALSRSAAAGSEHPAALAAAVLRRSTTPMRRSSRHAPPPDHGPSPRVLAAAVVASDVACRVRPARQTESQKNSQCAAALPGSFALPGPTLTRAATCEAVAAAWCTPCCPRFVYRSCGAAGRPVHCKRTQRALPESGGHGGLAHLSRPTVAGAPGRPSHSSRWSRTRSPS